MSSNLSLENIAASKGQFLQLLIVLRQRRFQTHSDGNREKRLQDLLRWLQHNFSDNVDWVTLADQFQLPLCTLYRQLKQQTGMIPQSYFNRLRLLEARKQLKKSDKTITEIPCA